MQYLGERVFRKKGISKCRSPELGSYLVMFERQQRSQRAGMERIREGKEEKLGQDGPFKS